MVVTRTLGLGIDVEAEDIGVWVELGDAEGMAAATKTRATSMASTPAAWRWID